MKNVLQEIAFKQPTVFQALLSSAGMGGFVDLLVDSGARFPFIQLSTCWERSLVHDFACTASRLGAALALAAEGEGFPFPAVGSAFHPWKRMAPFAF